jgi:hypothetical protein
MLLILLGVVAAAIIGAGVGSRNEPLNRPPLEYELNVARMTNGIAAEPVQVFPNQYFKYKHIVHQAFDYSCGSAALTTVLQYHLGLAVTEKDAMEGMLEHGEKEKIIARRGFSLLDMKRYVATLGSDSGGFHADIDDLAKLDQPAIVPASSTSSSSRASATARSTSPTRPPATSRSAWRNSPACGTRARCSSSTLPRSSPPCSPASRSTTSNWA